MLSEGGLRDAAIGVTYGRLPVTGVTRVTPPLFGAGGTVPPLLGVKQKKIAATLLDRPN